MIEALLSDVKHYADAGGVLQSPGFWCGATYRLGSWAHGVKSRPLRLGLLGAYKAAALPWQVVKNVTIPARTKIGHGLCIHHAFNIVMPPDVEIGDNCTLYHDVTLGRGPVPGVPKLGNNVTVYAGAKILGGITIGDDVEIGANAVVIRDVEAGSVVSAPPARAIPRETMLKMRQGRAANDG